MMMRLWYFVLWIAIFAKALAKANWDVVKHVLAWQIRIRPGFLEVPMEAATDFEITSLANSITLTPGTISVHIPPDQKSIIIHALDVGDDPEAVRQDVIQTLEANILRWTRPPKQRRGPAS